MKKSVPGGIFLLIACICAPAPASPALQGTHPRASFFNSNQPRSDVPAHLAKIFAALDLNHDGFVTKEEIAASEASFDQRMAKTEPKRAAKMFARLDTDHDGKLTMADFDAARAARTAGGQPGTAPKHRSKPSLLRLADANDDGVVTRAEFDAAISSGKVKSRHANMRGSAIVRMFDVADANKDGRLSLEEAQRAMLDRFDAADLNHDGVLTPDERRQAARTARTKHGTS